MSITTFGRRGVVLVIACLTMAINGPPDSLRGDNTAFRHALSKMSRSWLHQAVIWAHGDYAIAIRLDDPAGRHFIGIVNGKRLERDKDADLWPTIYPGHLPSDPESRGAILHGRLIFVVADRDSEFCGFNDLTGPRLIGESLREQKTTAKILPCKDVMVAIKDLGLSISDQDYSEMRRYLLREVEVPSIRTASPE